MKTHCMRHLNPSSARGIHAVWLVVNGFLLCWLLLLTACTTAPRSGAGTQGCSETQLGRNVFAVRVDASEQASTRATERCLLRCAEVTLAYGFSHFVVLESAHEQATATPNDGHRMMANRPGDGGITFVSSEAGPLSSANTIACFRRQPPGYPEAYEAEAVFNRLAGRYGVRNRPEARTNPSDAAPLQFSLYPSFEFLPRTTPDQIVFLEPSSARRTIVIGILSEWENPCETVEKFQRQAALTASILGAQAVQIQGESRPARRDGPVNGSGFAANLLLVPQARLGLQDEGELWPRKELVVRGFDKDSLAPGAGLRVGDRIVEVNGVDVLRERRFADGWLSWSVGQTVVVTFVRDGMQMSVQTKTIAN